MPEAKNSSDPSDGKKEKKKEKEKEIKVGEAKPAGAFFCCCVII